MKALLVATTGGHLAQLVSLRSWWSQWDRHWVVLDGSYAREELAGEDVTWAHGPTHRNPVAAVRNGALAHRVLRTTRPDVVVSTGAAVAVPFFAVAWLYGIRTAYLEVFDRIDSPTMTGQLCYPFTDLFCTQWEQQERLYPGATTIGPAL